MSITLDFRPRCKYCNKIPRGKIKLADYKKYKPFCSYAHQEMWELQVNINYLNDRLKEYER